MSTPTDNERIAKVMARAGVASRRDAERMILEGRVSVNGKKIASPALDVSPKDKITLDGRAIDEKQPTRLWLYYKPLGLVVSEKDEKGRQTIFDTMPEGMPRVMSVGRLDLNSEGLLLLTNDGELKRRLELPETGWLRKYRVRVNGQPNDMTFDPLRRGITVEGEDFQPMDVDLDRQQGANAWLTVGIREGRNREIRRAMTAVNLIVNRLIRVSYGPFRLNEMKPGDIVEVKAKVMRDQLGALLPGNEDHVERPGRIVREGEGPRSYDQRDRAAPADSYQRRGDRPFGKPGFSKGPRADGDRPFSRGPRPEGDRPFSKGPRADGDRPFSKGPRPEGDRPFSRGPRPDGDRPFSKGPRPDGDRPFSRGPRPEGDRPFDRAPRAEGEDFARKPRHKGPARAEGGEGERPRTSSTWSKGPRSTGFKSHGGPAGKGRAEGFKSHGDSARGDRPAKSYGDRPAKPFGERSERPAYGKPSGDRPFGKPAGERSERPAYGKPSGDRPFGKPSGERSERPAGKPYGKPSGERSFGGGKPGGERGGFGGKPGGKSFGSKSFGKPAGDRPRGPSSDNRGPRKPR